MENLVALKVHNFVNICIKNILIIETDFKNIVKLPIIFCLFVSRRSEEGIVCEVGSFWKKIQGETVTETVWGRPGTDSVEPFEGLVFLLPGRPRGSPS